jgi:heme exporter protein D
MPEWLTNPAVTQFPVAILGIGLAIWSLRYVAKREDVLNKRADDLRKEVRDDAAQRSQQTTALCESQLATKDQQMSRLVEGLEE